MWTDGENKNKSNKRAGPKPRDGEPEDGAEWARTKLGFAADAAQARVLRTGSRRVVLNCTRQWGKSTVTAAKAVHEAVTKPESLTIVVSPSARQSGELVRKSEGFVRRLGIRPKGDGDNEISVMLPNGSRIVGLPGSADTVRGFSAVSLLLVDEAARVPDGQYLAVRPMLAVSAGALWLMSTPRGKRGFFYEAWEKGGTEWERVRVPAEECPRIPRMFLEDEKRTMGERCYRQEYGCEFTDSVSAVFDSELVTRAIRWDVTALRID